jgi:hypothetical protein
MILDDPPHVACWRHRGLRSGFEVSFFAPARSGLRIAGTTTALQDGDAWVVSYVIELDELWRTRRAQLGSTSASGAFGHELDSDGQGHWLIDGEKAAHLDGCLDIDLEASAMTNTLPVHRLNPAPNERFAAPAAYLPVAKHGLERLEQFYTRSDDDDRLTFLYEAPAFDFQCRLAYDTAGLVLDYPGIAIREG